MGFLQVSSGFLWVSHKIDCCEFRWVFHLFATGFLAVSYGPVGFLEVSDGFPRGFRWVFGSFHGFPIGFLQVSLRSPAVVCRICSYVGPSQVCSQKRRDHPKSDNLTQA